MTRVLVLDTATKTGWASLVDGVIVAHGLLRLDAGIKVKETVQRHPLILSKAFDDIDYLIADQAPDFIVIEHPHLRGASSFLTVAIYAVVQLLCARRELGFYPVHTAEWQSRIIPGPNRPKGITKLRSIAHVKAQGFDPETDDVADALCIAEYVATYLEFSAGATGPSSSPSAAPQDGRTAPALNPAARAAA